MMDPLSCFSIACNVIQVISFAHEVTSIIKRIKKDGTVDPELRAHAVDLSTSSEGLQQYLKSCNLQHLPKNQAELWDVALECLATSAQIQSKIEKIDSSRGGRVMKVVKLKWEKSSFEQLEQDMRKYQDSMQTHILIHLCNQSDAVALEQEVEFQNLDQILQKFIRAYGQGQKELKSLILNKVGAAQTLILAGNEATTRRIEAESHQTREHVTTTQAAIEFHRHHNAQRKQLLESLRDQDMNARRNQIERSYTETFSWVFNHEIQRPWDSFTKWLSSTDSIYWICGKAGSGKSTLMKFLIDDERTCQYLDKWAPECETYSHFIWNSGTPEQRSICGLLRSLLYQILEGHEHILDDVLRTRPKVAQFRNSRDWSKDDLEDIFFQSLLLHQKGICIFLDGLDEIDPRDGPFDLLSLVKQIPTRSGNKGLKVCVSSRPELSFQLGLEPFPLLRLQDLTKHDVKAYATDFMKTKCSFNLTGTDEHRFIEEIVTKANGVFLWVSLALKSLQRGITNGDDPTKLMERLLALPSELEKLYHEMLKRFGDDQGLYNKDAAVFFGVFLFFSEVHSQIRLSSWLNLFCYAVALDPLLRETLLKAKSPPPPLSLKKSLLDVERKLTSRCAGILEAVSYWEENLESILSREDIRPWEPIKIEALHRSAKDFLLSMRSKVLDQEPTSAAEHQFHVLQAIALEDSYPPGYRSPDENKVMDIMSNMELALSNEQELEILTLIQGIYERNGWCEFYEVAARYGLCQPLTYLLKNNPRDVTPLRNYLLICVLSDYPTGRKNNMISQVLRKGDFSNDYVGLVSMPLRNRSRLLLPVPLLGYFLYNTSVWLSDEKYLDLVLKVGVDFEQRFLGGVFGFSRVCHSYYAPATRPQYIAYPLGSCDFDLLAEINCVELILHRCVEHSNFTSSQILAIMSRLGLDPARAHRKVLLYSHAGIAYGAEDEDSDTLNKIFDWPPPLRIQKGYVDITDEERQVRFEKVREVLKGKEVDDVQKWLTERGHILVDESDIAGISAKTSTLEMARIYQRLSENYGRGRR